MQIGDTVRIAAWRSHKKQWFGSYATISAITGKRQDIIYCLIEAESGSYTVAFYADELLPEERVA